MTCIRRCAVPHVCGLVYQVKRRQRKRRNCPRSARRDEAAFSFYNGAWPSFLWVSVCALCRHSFPGVNLQAAPFARLPCLLAHVYKYYSVQSSPLFNLSVPGPGEQKQKEKKRDATAASKSSN